MNDGCSRSLHNTYGLRPALVKGTNEIAPLTPFHYLDSLGLLRDVPTLNFHTSSPLFDRKNVITDPKTSYS